MTDENKTEMESSRPSPLDAAAEKAHPRQLTRDNQEWFSCFQKPAERLPYDCVESNIPEVPDDARSYCCAAAKPHSNSARQSRTVSAALRQAKQYSASVRCTASAALPQILAAHNGKTRVTIKYRQPLPPARSLVAPAFAHPSCRSAATISSSASRSPRHDVALFNSWPLCLQLAHLGDRTSL
jgi:hypothetical protein